MGKDISCKKAVELISKREELPLGREQRFQLWKHLEDCVLCRRFSVQNKLIIEGFIAKRELPVLLDEEKQELIRVLKEG